MEESEMATKEQMAQLSLYVYNIQADAEQDNRPNLPAGWVRLSYQPDDLVGFSYGIFKNALTGEIVVAYTGTNEKQAVDFLLANIPAGLGLSSLQVNAAARVAAEAISTYGASNVSFTGHSLGGGLASVVAVWFDRPAITFDAAPFEVTARNPLAVISARNWISATIGISDPALDSFGPIGNFSTRESAVTGYYAIGEVLEPLRAITATVVGTEIPLTFGNQYMAGASGLIGMHSQALLTAGLLSDNFRAATVAVQHTIPLILNGNLYGHEAATSSERNFLVDLIRSEQSALVGQGKLSHFAADLQKLGTNIAGLNIAAQYALIAQGVEWYYWQGTNYAGQEFFTQTGSLLQYTTARGDGLEGAQNRAAIYTGGWLASVQSDNGAAYAPILRVDYEQWNISAGDSGVTATARDATKSQIYIGGAGADTFTGGNLRDVIFAGAGNDTLDGGAGSDKLYGGTGGDTYAFTGAFGKDTILDADGRGSIDLGGQTLGTFQGTGVRGGYAFELGGGAYAGLAVVEDKTSSTGYKAIIVQGGNTANTITIQNFDLAAAQSTQGGSAGYLGIKIDPSIKVALVETSQISTATASGGTTVSNTGGISFWSQLGASLSSLDGKASSFYENTGKTFTIYLSQAASEGQTLTLSVNGSATGLKAILGDSIVDANGAVIILAEGQTQVKFALVSDTTISADQTGALSVHYQGSAASGQAAQNVTSNSWGLTLKDAGDQSASFTLIGQYGDSQYFANTSNATASIDGGAGNDLLGGTAVAELIKGGDGNDFIAGGGGHDVIEGGAGNDWITGGVTARTNGGFDSSGQFTLKPGYSEVLDTGAGPMQGYGWALYDSGYKLLTPNSIYQIDDANQGTHIDGGAGLDNIAGTVGDDVLDGGVGDDGDGISGGYGNDILLGRGGNDSLWGDGLYFDPNPVNYARHGNDYLDGGAGNDILGAGAGNDILYGGMGNDILDGDSGAPGQYHGNDYLDGEDGNDIMIGGGGDDTLYGGAGNDEMQGDNSTGMVAAQYHGEDYLDGEEGDDRLTGGGKDDILYGGAGQDVLSGDANASDLAGADHGNDYLDGESGDDVLRGGGKDDTLFGGLGNDMLWGDINDAALLGEFNGNDYLDGEEGNDLLVGGGKDDFMLGGTGDDTLLGDDDLSIVTAEFQGNDYLDGGDGNDYLRGDGGADTLMGGYGNDYLDGGTGADYMEGGAGNDTYVIDDEGDVIVEAGTVSQQQFAGARGAVAMSAIAVSVNNVQSSVSYTLGPNLDNLTLSGINAINATGNALDNVLLGNAGANRLEGAEGNDTLVGGLGADTLVGGAGDDVYDVDNLADTVLELSGEGNDLVRSSVDFTLSQDVENLQATGVAAINLNGNALNNSVWGNYSNNVIIGAAGNDVLVGGGQDDTLSGGTGDDTLLGDDDLSIVTAEFQGNDYLDGGDGNDYLRGDGGTDTLLGGNGSDYLDGGTGADYMEGGAGNDTLVGGLGADTLVGGAGDDVYDVDNLADTVLELSGEGNDLVRSSVSFTLSQGVEDLQATGAAAINLDGNALDNSVWGNSGNNVISGMLGNDDLQGGAGNDIYVFNRGDGQDFIDNTDLLRDSAQPSLLAALDTLRFGTGIAANDVAVFRSGNDLILRIKGATDQVAVLGYYSADDQSGTITFDHKIDRVEFTNGVVWTQAMIQLEVDKAINNHIPIVQDSVPALQARAGDVFSYSFSPDTMYDEDAGDSLTYSVSLQNNAPLPAWLSYDAQTLTLSGTPDAGHVGALQFVLWATDNYGAAKGISVDLTVAEPNRAPNLVYALPDRNAVQGNTFSYTLPTDAFADPDVGYQQLTYSATLSDGSGLPAWLVFETWGRFVGTPNLTGITSVRVVATDSSGLSAGDVFDINVTVLPPSTAFDDILSCGPGNDVLNGLAGNDTIYGNGGNDTLIGGTGYDSLYGGDGNDTLSEGEAMYGGLGLDTYKIFSVSSRETAGTWETYITGGADGGDIIVVGGGLGPGDIGVRRDAYTSNLILTNFLNGESVNLVGFVTASNTLSPFAEVRFESQPGTVWTTADLRQKAITGDANNNVLRGYIDVANALSGGGGDDQLSGGNLADALDGGAGADYLLGGPGYDTYVFGLDSGADRVYDTLYGGGNIIQLKPGITPANLRLLRTGQNGADVMKANDSLVLLVESTGARLWVDEFFQANGTGTVSEIRFADGSGTVWTYTDLVQRAGVSLTGAQNTQVGTAVDDLFVVDNIMDVVSEAAGGGVDTVRSSVSYVLPSNVENLELIGPLAVNGTGNSTDNILRGSDSNNVLKGAGGSDQYYGGRGDDTYLHSAIRYSYAANLFYATTPAIYEYADEGYDTLVTDAFSLKLPDNVERLFVPSVLNLSGFSYMASDALVYSYIGNSLDNVIDLTGANFDRFPGTSVRIDGGAGNDIMVGGNTFTTYVVDSLGDVVVASAIGRGQVEASVTYTLTSNLSNLTLTGSTAINGFGNQYNNVLDGGSNSAGNALVGYGGDDTYRIDLSDTVIEQTGGGNDRVIVTGLAGTAPGTLLTSYWANVETIELGFNLGNVDINGSALGETIYGSFGSNAIAGMDGDDRIYNVNSENLPFYPVSQNYGLPNSSDHIDGGNGNDTIYSYGGFDVIAGGAGQDTIHLFNTYYARVDGGAGDDVIESKSVFRTSGSGAFSVQLGVGSGHDTVSTDTLRTASEWTGRRDILSSIVLSTGTDASSLRFSRSGANLLVQLGGPNDNTTVVNFFEDDTSVAVQSSLDAIRLNDGTMMTRDAIVAGLNRTDLQTSSSGNDLLITTSVSLSLSGGNGDDQLFGQATNDQLDGGAGHDRLYGGDGNDQLSGGIGNDTLIGGHGADVYRFSAGWGADVIDELQASEAQVFTSRELLDDASVDAVVFDSSVSVADIVLTMAQKDLLVTNWTTGDTIKIVNYFDTWGVSTGLFEQIRFADGTVWSQATITQLLTTMYGTSGADTLDALANTITMYGLESNDTLNGNDGANYLYGGLGNDNLNGFGGNDFIDGGLGDDQLSGGAGDDSYVVDSSFDTVTENAGEGMDQVFAQVTYTLGANLENLVLTGAAAIGGTGNGLSNSITGNAANNFIDGGAGADLLLGGLGDDTYVVDHAGDVIAENQGEGTDLVQSSASHTLAANVENLTLSGSAAINGTGNGLDNILTGNSAINTLTGGAGNDWLDGQAGADKLLGGLGNDTYVVDNSGDLITENLNEGTDTVNASVAYTLATNVENLTLTGSTAINGTGNALGNVLTGNSAANTLSGLAGDDQYRINVGGGADRVIDTAGNDRIVFGAGIAVTQMTATRVAGVIKLAISANDSVSFDDAGGGVFAVEQFEFADGSVFGAAWINSLLPNAPPAATNLGSAETYTEDTARNLVDIVVSDADSVNTSVTLTLSNVAAGSLNSGTSGAVTSTYNAVSGVWAASGAITNVNILLAALTFTPAANFNGNFSIATSVSDGISPAVTGSKNFSGTAVNDAPTGGVLITGVATQNQTLTASNLLGDVDGMGPISYQWKADGAAIAGAVNNTLVLGLPQVGKAISVTATYTDGQGTLESVASVVTATVAAAINSVVGTSGADTLSGTTGADQLTGLAGNDTYVVNHVGDVVVEALNEGIDTVQASLTYTLAANVENLSLTGTTAINGTGNALNNVLTGNTANNVLTGGAGDDTLDGQAGSDTLIGGSGNDTYYLDVASDVVTELVNEGTDTVIVGFSYALNANVENLTLTGATALNGTGNALANVLIGNAAANALDGGAGADTLNGGAGDDSYVVDNAGDVVTENLNEGNDLVNASVSYTLAANVENLTLTGTAAINGTGNTLNNTLTGNSADNMLDGGTGADTLIGGAGNDIYYVDNTGDVTTEAAAAGTDTVVSSITWTLGTNLENLTLAGVVSINATGNAVANVLTGNAGDNVLSGGAGADTLIGGLGNDTYVVDMATDVVTEGLNEGLDLVQSSVTYTLSANVENLTLTGTTAVNGTGNALDNVLTGNSAINALTGGAGNDTYVVTAADTTVEAAGAGTDTVQSAITWTLATNVENLVLTGTTAVNGTGNASDNVLTGNSAANVLTGGAGNDTYVVGTGDTTIEAANAGIDTVQSAISWTLATDVENLTLNGSAAVNGTGNALANLLVGNAGANVITGGLGADTLTGGAGADTFVLASLTDSKVGAGSRDIISDFLSGIDKISFSGIDANTAVAGDQAFTMINTAAFSGTAGQLRYSYTGSDTVFEGDINGDKVADFQLQLTGNKTFVAADLLL
jgi:trimeric autotransporter adhesin